MLRSTGEVGVGGPACAGPPVPAPERRNYAECPL